MCRGKNNTNLGLDSVVFNEEQKAKIGEYLRSSRSGKMSLFPAITSEQLTGNETIADGVKLVDYWRWAHSNLIDNAERGAFAEYLVHTAVGATSTTRVNWDKYDVLSPKGIQSRIFVLQKKEVIPMAQIMK